MDEERFVRNLQEAVCLRMDVNRNRTEQIVGAVFSALSTGLTAGEIDRFILQLPPPLKKLWSWRAIPKSVLLEIGEGEGVTTLSRKQFLTLIQMEGELVSTEEAEAAVQCVIHFIEEAIGSGGLQDAPGPLPWPFRGPIDPTAPLPSSRESGGEGQAIGL